MTSLDSLFNDLKTAGLSPQRNVPLVNHCTWHVGGAADIFVSPSSMDNLSKTIALLSETTLPVFILGNGSNLIFDDTGFRGVVLNIGPGLSRKWIEGKTLIAEAGVAAWRVALMACHHGLTGLEHIVGIPGTIGGMTVMNAGSLRHNIGDTMRWVEVMDRQTGDIQRLDAAECGFSYRHSNFTECKDHIVVRCAIDLEPGDKSAMRKEMLRIIQERRDKFPLRYPSAGSVFQSTATAYEEIGPPGYIIESLEMKGTQIGGMRVSEQHANFIINTGGGTAADIFALIQLVKGKAKQRYGIEMVSEVLYIAPDGKIQHASSVNR